MGDDTGNGRNAFFQGHWSGFPPQPRQGNYLVPGLHPYAPSSVSQWMNRLRFIVSETNILA